MKFKILVILLFSSIFLFSQSTKRQYIGLSIGPSFPSTDFAKGNINDSTSGWAKTGVAINLTYSYRLTHNFGIYVTAIFSSNQFDNIRYKDALEKERPEYGVSVESTKNWSGGGILVGPYIRLPLSDNFSWDFRGSFGFFGANSPKITIRTTLIADESQKEEYYRESGSAFSYTYSFGTGFKYKLSKYYVLLFGDYFNSPLKFQNASGWDWEDEPYIIEFSQNISYISVTIGLGFYF
jgi:hypothetical protein